MPALTVDPTDWAITIHRRTDVVIRHVVLAGDEHWRVVTGEDDRSHRRLVGYWGTFDEACCNALAYVEQQLPPAWLATGGATRSTLRTMTPQEPPRTGLHDPFDRGLPDGVDTVWSLGEKSRPRASP